MRKVRMLVVAGVAAAALITPAAPAQASCQTNPDVGDVCKALEVVCNTTIGHKFLDYCN